MAVTDFQAAWTELQLRIAQRGPDGKKTSWGADELLREMGLIAGEKVVPEDLLDAAKRLTGFPFTTHNVGTDPSSDPDHASAAAMAPSDPHPPDDQGGHDGAGQSEGDRPPVGSGSSNGRTGSP